MAATPFTSRRSIRAFTCSRAASRLNEPAKLLLIKNDPRFNEQWPRAARAV